MKKSPIYITIPVILLIMMACESSRYNFDYVIIPREVVNFKQVNSQYDDYNSDLPRIESIESFTLIFSTNRESARAHFDLVSYECQATFDQVTGDFGIDGYQVPYALIDTVNTEANEWGPYFTKDNFKLISQDYIEEFVEDTSRLFFSSDREGDMDIYCWYYILDRNSWEIFMPVDTLIVPVGLNTSSNEGYLCMHPGEVDNREVCYFTSDRDGSFDIYRAVSDPGKRIEQTASPQITRVDILSGEADDKCPYILGDMMVFVSNRNGGQGGFDLWYSKYEDGAWTTPENFGADINSASDEYRPIVIRGRDDLFLNDMMIFSSNRPGGLGGFDLYYTGMDRQDSY